MKNKLTLNALSFTGLCCFLFLAFGSGDTKNSGSSITSSSAETNAANEAKIIKTGEAFNVGYFNYLVNSSWYTKKLSGNQFLNQPPDAMYLFVDISVQNGDKSSSNIPPFKLIDENGAEYDTSQKAWASEGSMGLLTSLNPGVAKRGYVIFDVPQNHKYKLKVSGGYLSGAGSFVELTPTKK